MPWSVPLVGPFAALGIGYLIRRSVPIPSGFARVLMGVIAFGVWPIVSLLSFWVIEFSHWRLALLPVVGGLTGLACLVPAGWLARWHHLSRPQVGSFLTCALFSNIGYIGQFIIFALYGESALALTMLYAIYFSPLMYFVGMNLANRYGSKPEPGHLPIDSAEQTTVDLRPSSFDRRIPPGWLRLMPFVAMGLGLALSYAGLERPAWLGTMNQRLVPWASIGYLFATGLTLHMRSLGSWPGPASSLCLVKFLYAPLIALTLGWLLGLHELLGGLPLKIVLIEAMMPVALSSMMLATLFHLDQAFTTALWLVNTLAFLVCFPLCMTLAQYFGV